MKKVLLSLSVLTLMTLLFSCGKDKPDIPAGYPTAYFPICEPAGIVYSDVSGIMEMPVYSVDYESKLSCEDIVASYMLTIPNSKVSDTPNGYKLTGQKDIFSYSICIEQIEKSKNFGAKSLVKTVISSA